jgi:hypothetical protein
MKPRQIHFAEALELSKIEDADFYPFAIINDDGIVNIEGFIAHYAKTPKKHVFRAWADKAESAAVDLLGGFNAIIEMRGAQTYNRRPATLKFEEYCFNWFINQ